MISDLNIRINRDLCIACGTCVDRCIMDNLRLSVGPCRQSCPLHMNCQGYVRLIAQGRPEDAARELAAQTPFASILGRVCSHPCEDACERGLIDGAVHIRALKRFLSDNYPESEASSPEIPAASGRRVAIVGSGPAGLSAAYETRLQGHEVTVFEAEAQPGGMLRYGIPGFRLPLEEVDRTIGMLTRMGVVFKTNQALGGDFSLDDLERDFDAAVLAIGAWTGRKLNIPGHDLEGVVQGLDLLKKAKTGVPVQVGQSVLVIGGGNTAVDAALTCRRLGADKVALVCLESRREMPAFEAELEEALEEGIAIRNGWGPVGLARSGQGGIEISLAQCLSLFDSDGRFNPCLDSQNRLTLEADTVVLAVGQSVNVEGLPEELVDKSSGRLAADALTLQNEKRGKVFVCGDCLSGPGSVVEALASGREAAFSVERFLKGEGLRWGRGFWNGPYVKEYEADHSRAVGGPRGRLEKLPPAERKLSVETEQCLSSQAAAREAERCLSCGRAAEINRTCWYCLPCEIECPAKALEVRMPYLVR